MNRIASLTKFRRDTARKLRVNQTGAELALWRELRKLEIKGTHFRRQVPIGPYVADFACLASQLVIELDGSQHGDKAVQIRDDARTRWLESEGYRVLRFWNNDLTGNLRGVMETIHAALCGASDGKPRSFKHSRRVKVTPPRRAARADPPPPGEGEGGSSEDS